jgi:hypothetical protein
MIFGTAVLKSSTYPVWAILITWFAIHLCTSRSSLSLNTVSFYQPPHLSFSRHPPNFTMSTQPGSDPDPSESFVVAVSATDVRDQAGFEEHILRQANT